MRESIKETVRPNAFIIYSHEQAFRHMTQERSYKEQELYIITDEILFHLWDANCVSIDDTCREEYLPYLPQVYDLLISSDDGQELHDYLLFIEENQFGITKGDNLALERASRLVNVLLDYKEKIFLS
jgi:hypothetical protein